MRVLLVLLVVLLGLASFWLFLLKLLIRLAKGRRTIPCPASLSWVVDLPIRRRYMGRVLDRVGIRPGETVLELGPGPGAFTVEAARRVGPEGKLIAVDIQAEMIERLKQRVRGAGLKNVATHVASAYELPLPEASVDRAFLVTVLPEIPDPVRGLREVFRVLKPGAVFSTTEEFFDPDYPLRRTSSAWARAAGFQPSGSFGCWLLYTLNFRKPDRGGLFPGNAPPGDA